MYIRCYRERVYQYSHSCHACRISEIPKPSVMRPLRFDSSIPRRGRKFARVLLLLPPKPRSTTCMAFLLQPDQGSSQGTISRYKPAQLGAPQTVNSIASLLQKRYLGQARSAAAPHSGCVVARAESKAAANQRPPTASHALHLC